jgi:hypothetical protein
MTRAWLAALALAGCGAPATGVVVTVYNDDLVIGRDLDAVHLILSDTAQPMPYVFRDMKLPLCDPNKPSQLKCYDFPISFVVVPGPTDSSAEVVLEVDGELAGAPVLADGVEFTFLDGHRQSLDLVLYSGCVGKLDCAPAHQICDQSRACKQVAPEPYHDPDAGVDLASQDFVASPDLVSIDQALADLPPPDLPPPDFPIAPDLTTPRDFASSVDMAASGVIAWYHLDDGTDASGLSNRLSAQSGATFGVSGWAGGALSTNGTGVASAPDAPSLEPSTITVEAWVNYSTSSNPKMVVAKGTDWQLGFDAVGHAQAGITVGSTATLYQATSVAVISPSAWHHLAMTYDGASLVLYVDGGSLAVTSVPGAPALHASTQALTLGAVGAGANELTGTIDEVRIYSLALPASQILEDATLIARYHLDEGAGSVAHDASGYQRHATINGAVWSSSGEAGGALNCDGATTFASIPNDPSLTPSTLSVEVWVNGAAQSNNVWIVARPTSYGFYVDPSGTPEFTSIGVTAVGFNPFTSTWRQLVGTWDGSTNKVYLDGNSVATAATTGTLPSPNVGLYLCGYMGGTNLFHGQIDEVRIYGRALQPADVTAHFASPGQ